jgi:hypothetical protein
LKLQHDPFHNDGVEDRETVSILDWKHNEFKNQTDLATWYELQPAPAFVEQRKPEGFRRKWQKFIAGSPMTASNQGNYRVGTHHRTWRVIPKSACPAPN